jgi:5-methylcytosine-specific restriction endonuclease McrA
MNLNKNTYKSIVSKLSNNELAIFFENQRKNFLQSKEWKLLRKDALQKYGKKCHKCGSIKNINVDHIKPRKFYPELALDFNNLQILCSFCNKNKGNKNCKDYRQKIDI